MYRIPNNAVSDVAFKTEWSHVEFLGVKAAILEWLQEQDEDEYFCRFASVRDVDSYYGFVYTSTGTDARLGVCNVEEEIEDGYRITAFLLTEQHQVVVETCDQDDNERYYYIG